MSESRTSKKFTINAAFFQEIKDDHLQLRELLESLRRLVARRPALPNHASELVEKLSCLCDQIALHFSLEEAYGYLEDLIEVTPHLHFRTGKLREQHKMLFVMVRDLADTAASRHKGSTAELMQIADQFLAFDHAFKAHESAETELILSAVHQDVGVGD